MNNKAIDSMRGAATRNNGLCVKSGGLNPRGMPSVTNEVGGSQVKAIVMSQLSHIE